MKFDQPKITPDQLQPAKSADVLRSKFDPEKPCTPNENPLYSISLGVASLQGDSVSVATALSPATGRPFQIFISSAFCRIRVSSLCSLLLYGANSLISY
jgi:hypothetical protein